MVFNQHWELKNKHAVLSPSSYHWLNYDEEKMEQVYINKLAAEEGTELHDVAARMIKHDVLRNKTLTMYVKDAVKYKMAVEQPLKYSDICFGTADAISFNNNVLRIHDLKTGSTPAHMEQLEIYAALFCLEYSVKPESIKIELRIYQSEEIVIHNPLPEIIISIMDAIRRNNSIIDRINKNFVEV